MLSQLDASTLVIHRQGTAYPSIDISRRLTSDIPGAQLLPLEGESAIPFLGDSQEVIDAVFKFLGLEAATPSNEVETLQTSPLVESLSPRERQVLSFIADGLSNQEVADKLVITVGTTKSHLNSIYRKLDAGGRTRAVARARDLGLL